MTEERARCVALAQEQMEIAQDRVGALQRRVRDYPTKLNRALLDEARYGLLQLGRLRGAIWEGKEPPHASDPD